MFLNLSLLLENLIWSFKIKQKKQCEIFEIKHSKQMVSTQYRHINNEEKIVLNEAQFGKVVRKCVLYRGESQVLENGVEYKKCGRIFEGGGCAMQKMHKTINFNYYLS